MTWNSQSIGAAMLIVVVATAMRAGMTKLAMTYPRTGNAVMSVIMMISMMLPFYVD
jgi:hypothetical protein